MGPCTRYQYAFSTNFTDTGLFGVIVNGKCADGINSAVKNSRSLLAGNYSPAALDAAKAIVRTTLTEQCPTQRIQAYAAQALGKASIVSPEAQLARLAGLTAADIKAVCLLNG